MHLNASSFFSSDAQMVGEGGDRSKGIWQSMKDKNHQWSAPYLVLILVHLEEK